jgi:hypothetical protein
MQNNNNQIQFNNIKELNKIIQSIEINLNKKEKEKEEDILKLNLDFETFKKTSLIQIEEIEKVINIFQQTNFNHKNAILYIDADNVSLKYIPIILKNIESYANIVEKKAFGNWDQPNMKNWNTILEQYKITKIHQEQVALNKNATDMLLTTHLVTDSVSKKNIDIFAVVSNDNDYTPPIQELTNKSKIVHVYGKTEAKGKLRKVATEYFDYETMFSSLIEKDVKAKEEELKTIKEEIEIDKIATKNIKTLSYKIKEVFEQGLNEKNTYKDKKMVSFDYIGGFIKPKEYGYERMKTLLENHISRNLFEIITQGTQYFIKQIDPNSKSKNLEKSTNIVINQDIISNEDKKEIILKPKPGNLKIVNKISKQDNSLKELSKLDNFLTTLFEKYKREIPNTNIIGVEFGIIGKEIKEEFEGKKLKDLIQESKLFEAYYKSSIALYLVKK